MLFSNFTLFLLFSNFSLFIWFSNFSLFIWFSIYPFSNLRALRLLPHLECLVLRTVLALTSPLHASVDCHAILTELGLAESSVLGRGCRTRALLLGSRRNHGLLGLRLRSDLIAGGTKIHQQLGGDHLLGILLAIRHGRSITLEKLPEQTLAIAPSLHLGDNPSLAGVLQNGACAMVPRVRRRLGRSILALHLGRLLLSLLLLNLDRCRTHLAEIVNDNLRDRLLVLVLLLTIRGLVVNQRAAVDGFEHAARGLGLGDELPSVAGALEGIPNHHLVETTLIVLHLGADRKTRRGVRGLGVLALALLGGIHRLHVLHTGADRSLGLGTTGHRASELHWGHPVLGRHELEVSTEHLRGHHVQSLGHSFECVCVSVPVVECSCSLSVVTLGCFESCLVRGLITLSNGTQTKSILYFDRSLVRPVVYL